MRIGQGYDVHQLVEGRRLVVGGVDIPYHLGLLGHSDADVLTHAVIDALLGAAGLGDIGQHFPDSNPVYTDIPSLKLLDIVTTMVADQLFFIENVDATIIAEAPKMRPFIDEMRSNIATSMKVTIDQVNIKATTEEGMGFTGRGEGIAAQAICLLTSPVNEGVSGMQARGCGGCGRVGS
jgi:2-C-methyl-D-erythritol 2,4-cyclodiphosphate synthase